MPSRFHCVIESRAGGWIVRDLNSSNSTLMQGKRIATNPIQPGHLMMIGSTKLVIIDPSRKSPSEKDVVETDSERIAFQSDEPPEGDGNSTPSEATLEAFVRPLGTEQRSTGRQRVGLAGSD